MTGLVMEVLKDFGPLASVIVMIVGLWRVDRRLLKIEFKLGIKEEGQ